jgi:hypothetical protein
LFIFYISFKYFIGDESFAPLNTKIYQRTAWGHQKGWVDGLRNTKADFFSTKKVNQLMERNISVLTALSGVKG